MRIAVLSDIHGFSLALDVVRRDIAEQGPFDSVIVAGDLCVVGPDPRGVVDIVREEGWVALQGNTDFDLVEAANWTTDLEFFRYWVDEVDPATIGYLANLPFSHRLTPPGGASPEHDLLIVHANPHDLRQPLDPSFTDRELREIIGDEQAGVIAFGHIHLAYIRHLAGTMLVDVSAVGNAKDGDLRCKYGILTWDEPLLRWTAEIRRLDYPLEETKAQIRASALPDPEAVIDELVQASYDHRPS